MPIALSARPTTCGNLRGPGGSVGISYHLGIDVYEDKEAKMGTSDRSLSLMAARLMEVVGALGLTAKTVKYYGEAFDDISSFASAYGKDEWSDALTERYVARLDELVASGDLTAEVRRERRRALRMLVSLATTGDVDLSYAPGTPARYPVDAATADVVEAIVRSAGAAGVTESQLRPPVRHLLWYAAERGIPPLEIDDALIMEFLVEEVPRTNGGSRGHVLRCVKLATGWLKGHGGRVRRDYSSLKLKDGKRVIVPAFTEAEIRSIVASIDTGSAVGKRDLAIILLAYCTGLRGIDIRRLKLTDIDWRGQSVTLTQSKNHEPITCVLNGETMNALADYVLEGRPDCGLEEVFVTCLAPYRPLAANLHHMLDKRCEAAGVAKVPLRAFHSLRRSFETVMVSRGVPVETASQMMGHKTVEEDKPYITHDRKVMALVAMGFADVPVTSGVYATARGGDES